MYQWVTLSSDDRENTLLYLDLWSAQLTISYFSRPAVPLQHQPEAQVCQCLWLMKNEPKKQWFGFVWAIWSSYIIWLLWRHVDILFRAPGDEEAQEQNLIVSKGKIYNLTSDLPPDIHP